MLGRVGEIVWRHDIDIDNNQRYLNKLLLEGDSILLEKEIIQIFAAVESFIEKVNDFEQRK